jgi:very-short-patch-repair endonuclease
MGQPIKPEILARAKELRKNMTPAEVVLWSAVRRSQLGVHFRGQQVIFGMIVGLYCRADRI